jgi:hypothetical protein
MEHPLLQHDNALLHTGVRIIAEVQHLSFIILDCPFHSTIFALPDICLFPKLKERLRGHYCAFDNEMMTAGKL